MRPLGISAFYHDSAASSRMAISLRRLRRLTMTSQKFHRLFGGPRAIPEHHSHTPYGPCCVRAESH